MQRCLELAKLGAGHVAPNPMVGAVLAYEDRIIGEGYHRMYGEAHAEVNCINSVSDDDKSLIDKSVIYVSLEPCAHFGKTPPCADLIISQNISTVVVGCRDPFVQVDGKGIDKLRNAGVTVITGVLGNECKELNKRFFTFHIQQRPYIILKWAQSKNQKIANADFSRVLISNAYSNRMVHKWRSQEAGIMVGTNTSLQDDPALDTRNWTGPQPVRLVIDMNLRLPSSLQIFDGKQKTIIFNGLKNEHLPNVTYHKIEKEPSFVRALLKACYNLNIQSILIEGGNKLAQSFINENAWDEARVIENNQLIVDNGLPAPLLSDHAMIASETISTDTVSYYTNINHNF
ncbi:MAG: bifunctional diaminohydroxyphosphoribosylaminopyrimidine deaminase/5-amino-6-(5-phosphoribosylamino)uracil reductase RibD [Bacteroidota bacterium]|nr:bifunctional diaminohydroxyphosphoribosylaminopyrimidine deaminase/5-amino-6-(5-phosphoribosylamino)uracil reductase RibD [Bacteroidota bacterium]